MSRRSVQRTAALLVVLAACKGPADHGLEYDAQQFPGRYELAAEFEIEGLLESVIATTTYEVRARGDGRFDVFITDLWVDGTHHEDPNAVDPPTHDLALGERGPIDVRRNPAGPLQELHGSHDLTDSWMFLLPELPSGPVGVRTKWTANKRVPVKVATADVEVVYEVIRFDACPDPGPPNCVVYRFSADTGARELHDKSGSVVSFQHAYSGEGVMSTDGRFVGASAEITGTAASGPLKGKIALVHE